MVYQQCGSLCPQTCDNIGTSNCNGGCAEGCFCPDGQVISSGRCINPIACAGIDVARLYPWNVVQECISQFSIIICIGIASSHTTQGLVAE